MSRVIKFLTNQKEQDAAWISWKYKMIKIDSSHRFTETDRIMWIAGYQAKETEVIKEELREIVIKTTLPVDPFTLPETIDRRYQNE